MKMKKILSAFLALLFCIMPIASTGITADAALVTIETISEGETWRQSWSAAMEFASVKLNVTETGFYNFTVIDHEQTGCFYIEIVDQDEYNYYETIYLEEIQPSYTSKGIFLVAGHSYQLYCAYFDLSNYDEETYEYATLPADIEIVFHKSQEELPSLPTCELDSSNIMAQFTYDDDRLWLKYTTDAAGDYSLLFDDLHAYVTVYNAETGEVIAYKDTEYYDKYYGEYYAKEKLVLTLEADTEYYFDINAYRLYEYATITRLSIVKNEKDVKNIVAHEPHYTISSFYYVGVSEYDFSYKVTWSDNTSDIVYDLNDLEAWGYEAPTVEYAGEFVQVNGETYMAAGSQPVISTYNGIPTTLYFDVESILEFFSYLDLVAENDICTIEYEDDDEWSYWWRVKMSKSGIYSIWSAAPGGFHEIFDYWSIEIVDENNSVVEHNDAENGWYLEAGKEYVLNFIYKYNPYSYCVDVDFHLGKSTVKNGWSYEGNQWLYYIDDVKATSWQYIDGNWYYFDYYGYMQTGWKQISGKWYYFGSGGKMQTGWQQISGKWYYFNGSGAMLSGWQQIGGKWYYFNGSGAMLSGWQKIGSSWYYFNAGGAMQTGWQKIGSSWYYFSGGGAMQTGWQKIGSSWYYFSGGGAMQTGWLKLGSTWYYFNAGGSMATGWLKLGSTWYLFSGSGAWIQ